MRQTVICLLAVFLFAFTTFAQATLTVGTATGQPNTVVQVPLTLSGATTLPVAGLQWKMSYAKTTPIAFLAGPAATAASKSISCSSVTVALITTVCFIAAINDNVMANGVVAYLNMTLPNGFSGTAGIAISATLGTSANATALAVSGVSGKVTKATTTTTSVEEQPARAQVQNSRLGVVVDQPSVPVVKSSALSTSRVGIETGNIEGCVWSDGLKCTFRLLSPATDSGWVMPFSSHCDWFSAEPVWLDRGQSTFEVTFKPEVPGIAKMDSRLVVGVEVNAGENNILGNVSLK